MVVVGAMYALVTLACLLVLRQNITLGEQVEVYRKRAAPLVGREVPAITGVDRTGLRRTVAYIQEHRPTLVYSFSKGCGACQRNWPALQAIQKLSPDRLRIVYVNPFDRLSDDFLLEHGLMQDVLFTKLERFSEVSYQIRGTPQTELVDRDGRVIWASMGAFRPTDLAALFDAIEKQERKAVEDNQGVER